MVLVWRAGWAGAGLVLGVLAVSIIAIIIEIILLLFFGYTILYYKKCAKLSRGC